MHAQKVTLILRCHANEIATFVLGGRDDGIGKRAARYATAAVADSRRVGSVLNRRQNALGELAFLVVVMP